jgi:hypothetical protein
MPTGTISTPQFQAEVEMETKIFDSMFGDPGLTSLRHRPPQHPAVLRRDVGLVLSAADAAVS